ncbi:hypothetical protein [Paenibacillus eucommiae]|uniref:Glycosyltransferase RgtA/B/C/D-like domain-containing protein n=1 Tax=Paenibacillus eucommiae TaxID=1355755 RepID=A0ABS4J3L5_9BACL|nr:hypothetical protein [Paenibacillus eucommiae]MBP1994433.1 hypothetical protein [Paenibacillus eucommiae]
MNKMTWLIAFFISSTLVGILFLLEGNVGINLADEGYLWYGAIQTAMGDVPFLDFQSYDPGRYYWVALWFHIFGDTSILALRAALAIFQIIGLTFGLMVIRKMTKSWLFIIFAGVIMVLWMYPRHKLFEPSISMIGIYMIMFLLEKQSWSRYLLGGLFVGIAAFLGVNHGLYMVISFSIAIFYIWLKIDKDKTFKKILLWGSGVVIGYSPMLLIYLTVPGYFVNFMNAVKELLFSGKTNLHLPVPWPWKIDFTLLNFIEMMGQLSIGIFFLLVPIFAVGIGLYACISKKMINPAIAAASFVGLSYTHYAFDRADLGHLAQAIEPLIIVICLLSLKLTGSKRYLKSAIILSVLLLFTLISVGRMHPYFQKITSKDNKYITYKVSNIDLSIDVHTASLIDRVKEIKNTYVLEGENLFIAPHWPTMYPILGLKSPLWDIYMLFPETAYKQLKMIEELKRQNVAWVILGDISLDGRDDLRFQNTHPLIWEYFENSFEVIMVEGLPSNYKLLHIISE